MATFSNDAHKQLRGQTVTCNSSVAAKYLPTSCSNDGSIVNPGTVTPLIFFPHKFWDMIITFLDIMEMAL